LTIEIENFSFKTIIGLLEFEKKTPQKVVVNLIAKYDYKMEYL